MNLRALIAPVRIGARQLPPLGVVVLAAIGASLLAVIATTEWAHFNDEHAYWLAAERLAAGEALYDAGAAPNTPFAYWYPPPLAQLLVPLTTVLTPEAFSATWTVLLLICLWWLGGRSPLVALALIAFLPVAVELRFRNVHLLIAVLVVLALRRNWAYWVVAAAIKITPVLGVAYLAGARRYRDAIAVGVLGLGVLALSVVLSPGAWLDFIEVVGERATTNGGSSLPIPFPVRFTAGLALAVGAGVVARRSAERGGSARGGEAMLVVALTVANPTLWATALSLLIAIVPLWRTSEVAGGAALKRTGESQPIAR